MTELTHLLEYQTRDDKIRFEKDPNHLKIPVLTVFSKTRYDQTRAVASVVLEGDLGQIRARAYDVGEQLQKKFDTEPIAILSMRMDDCIVLTGLVGNEKANAFTNIINGVAEDKTVCVSGNHQDFGDVYSILNAVYQGFYPHDKIMLREFQSGWDLREKAEKMYPTL